MVCNHIHLTAAKNVSPLSSSCSCVLQVFKMQFLHIICFCLLYTVVIALCFALLTCSFSLLMLDCYVECWMLQLAKLWLVQQSLIIQVAKKASVLKRRKSKNRMEVPSNALEGSSNSNRRESEGDVVFYIEEPKAGIIQLSATVFLIGCQKVSDQTGKSAKVKLSMPYRTEMFGAMFSARC